MTDWLSGVTFVAFLIAYLTGSIEALALIAGFVPMRVGDAELFHQLGGPAHAVPVLLTPLSATLVHASWLHVGFNLLMLFFCGRHVEHVLGPWLTLTLYGIGAYAAAAAQWAVDPSGASPMVGASGAISALLGTYALLYSQQKVRAIGPLSANFVRLVWLAAGWVAIQLMIGVAMQGIQGELGNIAIAAHIGGFIAGLVLTRLALLIRFRNRPVSLQ